MRNIPVLANLKTDNAFWRLRDTVRRIETNYPKEWTQAMTTGTNPAGALLFTCLSLSRDALPGLVLEQRYGARIPDSIGFLTLTGLDYQLRSDGLAAYQDPYSSRRYLCPVEFLQGYLGYLPELFGQVATLLDNLQVRQWEAGRGIPPVVFHLPWAMPTESEPVRRGRREE